MPTSWDWNTAERFAREDREVVDAVRALVFRIVSFPRGFFIPPERREDVVQETLLSLLRSLSGARGAKPVNFKAFVKDVAYKRCVDDVRGDLLKADTVPIDALPLPAGDDPERLLLSEERRGLLLEIVGRLEPKCQEVIRLRTVDGLPWSAIAKRLNEPAGRLRVRRHACLEKARAMLAKRTGGRALKTVGEGSTRATAGMAKRDPA